MSFFLVLVGLVARLHAAQAPETEGILPDSALSSPQITKAIQEFQAAMGGSLLVAGAGPDAYRVVEASVRDLPKLPLEPVQVPFIGDAATEMDMALRKSNIACALRVWASPTGRWLIQAYGDCRVAEDDILDREEEQVLAAEAEVALPADVPGIVAETWQDMRLTQVHIDASRANAWTRWTVQDGQGHPVSTLEFARRTGDVITHTRLVREEQARRTRAIVHVGIGGALLASSAYVLYHSQDSLPQWKDFDPGSRYSFPSDSAYQQAKNDAEEAYQTALDAVPYADRAQIRNSLYTGIFLGAAGVSVTVTVPLVRKSLEARQSRPALYYRSTRAKALIDAYNANLLASPTGTTP